MSTMLAFRPLASATVFVISGLASEARPGHGLARRSAGDCIHPFLCSRVLLVLVKYIISALISEMEGQAISPQ